MTDPLAVDGAQGAATLDASSPEPLYRIAGLDSAVQPPLRLAGGLEHAGPLWHLTGGSGTLADGPIRSADIRFEDSPRGTPDHVVVALAFDRLDLDAILADRKRGAAAGADLSLAVGRTPGTVGSATLSAAALVYAGLSFSDASLAASLEPGRIAVDSLALHYIGAGLQASGQVEGAEGGGRVSAEIDMAGMEVQALRRALALGAVPITGRMDGHITVAAEGATLNRAARNSRVSAVATMSGGSVSRKMIELASTDPLALLRDADGMSPLACLLAVLDMRAGVGTVSPLRLRAAAGTITGRGQFDLFRRRLDITVSSDSRTTGALALDVPVRVSGAFADPTIRPAAWSPAGRAAMAAGDDLGALPASLQPYARKSPCLAARR